MLNLTKLLPNKFEETPVLARALFLIYKNLFSLAVYKGFKSHVVYPLKPPDDEVLDIIPFSEGEPNVGIKGLYCTKNFPAQDHSEERLAIVEANEKKARLAGLLQRPGLPSVPQNDEEYTDAVYPPFLKKAWPQPPSFPEELRNEDDLVGVLALKGPLAENVRKMTDDEIERFQKIHISPADESCFVIDTEALAKYPVKTGLLPLGSFAVMQVDDKKAGRMKTRFIVYRGNAVYPGSPDWKRAQKLTLCSQLTYQNIVRHNLHLHLLLSTVFSAVSVNRLSPEHPVRRLLHVCFKMVLIGNEELGRMHLRSPEGFFTKLFSFSHPDLIKYINDHIASFDLGRLDPQVHLKARQMSDAKTAYPLMDNVLPLWESVQRFVGKYIDHYYPTDESTVEDTQLKDWFAELDEKIPNGVKNYAVRPDREGIKKLCTLYFFASTVDHDLQNNVTWDYLPLSQYIPTVVREDNSLPPVDMALQFLVTIMVTWKPFNMLMLDDFSSLAPDADGSTIIREFLDELTEIQKEMDTRPHDPALVQPKNLNYSVSQ